MTTTEVSRMPKVTLYVKDADAPVWERARQLAGDSLSSVVGRALSEYVEQEETRLKAKSALEREATAVEIDVEPKERPKRKVKFRGVLAAEGDVAFSGMYLDAYVTTSGKIVVAHSDRSAGGLRVEEVRVFDTYKKFLASDPTHDLGAAVAETIGEEWVEEID